MSDSLLKQLQKASRADREAFLASLTPGQLADMAKRPWWLIGRPEQQMPKGKWLVWDIMAGRGFGKSQTGSENLNILVENNPVDIEGEPTEWGIFARSMKECRRTCFEGRPGILRVLRRRGLERDVDFKYNRSTLEIFFKSGQKIYGSGADDEDVGRGPNLAGAWLDEIAKWPYPMETWIEGIMPSLRAKLIDELPPRAIVTTTPKPLKILMDWEDRKDGTVHITHGSIYDNADNLPQAVLAEMLWRYKGTRMEAQELLGILLRDVPGALWTIEMLTRCRTRLLPGLDTICVAVDPATTSAEDSDETGIGVAAKGTDGRGYVLEDLSGRFTAFQWIERAIKAYDSWHAHFIVVEENQGGDVWIDMIHAVRPEIKCVKVRAKDNKRIRAEEASSLYEQDKISHVGYFDELELQMTTWTPSTIGEIHDDRLDWLVHAIKALDIANVANAPSSFLDSLSKVCPNCATSNIFSARTCSKCGVVFLG